MSQDREIFHWAAEAVERRVGPGEAFTAGFSAESSDFVRFSRGKVRQAGAVRQAGLSLRLVRGRRHASAALQLAGNEASDAALLDDAFAELRERVLAVPEDPHLLLCEETEGAERRAAGELPDAERAVLSLVGRDEGDRVGLYAGGSLARGFASSFGQRSFFETRTFHLDWSHVHPSGRAVKASYAGRRWDDAELSRIDARARAELEALGRPARPLPPGRYRVFLEPAAVEEILGLLSWDAFGEANLRLRSTPLLALSEGRRSLSPRFSLSEDVAGGTAPSFSPDGFPRPARVPLVTEGRHAGTLVSPRSAREFGVPTNGASEGEAPDSLALEPGDLPEGEALARLGTGVWVSNLWYLNYSDRPAGRITGVTRYACFWVEGGEIVAPIDAMRFDDSIYRFFGENLEALTRKAELRPSTETYSQRSTASMRVPGALVSDFAFTL